MEISGSAAMTTAPKDSTESVVGQALDAVAAGQLEVQADERTQFVKESLPHDHQLIYPPVQEFWDDAIRGRS